MKTIQKKLNVLVACEESQAVTIEFRKLGHIAYSCDLLPCSGGHPEWHLQQDVKSVLNMKWDLVLAFPTCTFLTVTGNRWFNRERYGEKAIQREKDRDDAVKFFLMFAELDAPFCIENPVGVMSSIYRKPDQIINPYEFGDAFEKKTCLWLNKLPLLRKTNIVVPESRTVFKSGKSMPPWYAAAWKLPKNERSVLRSKTFPGIAAAMAAQWSEYVMNEKYTRREFPRPVDAARAFLFSNDPDQAINI